MQITLIQTLGRIENVRRATGLPGQLMPLGGGSQYVATFHRFRRGQTRNRPSIHACVLFYKHLGMGIDPSCWRDSLDLPNAAQPPKSSAKDSSCDGAVKPNLRGTGDGQFTRGTESRTAHSSVTRVCYKFLLQVISSATCQYLSHSRGLKRQHRCVRGI